MANEIILYDIPTRGKPTCWSLNPWKTRAALNYKGLPYQTEWVEYPDLKPKFEAFGIPPNNPDNNWAEYSSPAVRLPDGSFVMDSRAIADALEALQPEPPLHLDSPLLERVSNVISDLLPALSPTAMPYIPARILGPRSAEYFERTRVARFGMPLQELLKSDRAGEAMWKNVDPIAQTLTTLLHEKPGPFVDGERFTYSDIVLGGLWVFVKKLDEQGLYARLLSYDKSFGEHYEAVKQWFERDDH